MSAKQRAVKNVLEDASAAQRVRISRHERPLEGLPVRVQQIRRELDSLRALAPELVAAIEMLYQAEALADRTRARRAGVSTLHEAV